MNNYFSGKYILGTGSHPEITKMPKIRPLLKWLNCESREEKILWYLKNAPWFTKEMVEAIVDYKAGKDEIKYPLLSDIVLEEKLNEKKSLEYFKAKEEEKI